MRQLTPLPTRPASLARPAILLAAAALSVFHLNRPPPPTLPPAVDPVSALDHSPAIAPDSGSPVDTAAGVDTVSADTSATFTNFETEPVRPIALSPDGRRLFAVNTADDRLEIFDVTAGGLERAGEVGVGLRPVAVALRGAGEAWVSNHLSDSVSVVDVSDPARARVTATVRVGDEPRDIVVAGPDHDRVFVATAYRGEELTPGIGRATVWVIDARDPAAPPAQVRLFGDKARGLAASADGRTVYAAIFHSGTSSTVIGAEDVARGGGPPVITPPNSTGQSPPSTGVVVQRKSAAGPWLDLRVRDWARFVPFDLPDKDVFILDAAADPPRVTGAGTRAGGTLFNLAVRPGKDEVWVTNTDPGNEVMFEPNLRGHVVDTHVTQFAWRDGEFRPMVLGISGPVDGRPPPDPADEAAKQLAQPTDIVFSANGFKMYIAAFGSRKVSVVSIDGRILDRIAVGFGPAGLALDEARGRLYVLNHLDATISVVDLTAGVAGQGRPTLATVPLRFDPTPEEVRAGRPFLYDAALTSGDGSMSCASCHVFGDTDHLAWDLGDPGGKMMDVPAAITHDNLLLKPRRRQFHPMKGPMTTQSLRGLAGNGPMHWRGDRFGEGREARDEVASFKQFNGAFVSLNGRAEQLSDADMTAFARFVLTMRYPPNPNQPLDRAYRGDAKAGFDFFTGPVRVDQGVATCADCHALPTGSNGRVNFEGDQISQDFKAAHLRNLYDKVGRFDVAGEQVRGFGFGHDGSFDTLVTFLELKVFQFPGRNEAERDALRRQLVAYLMQFDTGMAPAVGQQVTAAGDLPPADRARLDVLAARAAVGDCDLVARGQEGGRERGYLLAGGAFRTDRAAEPPLPLADLLAQAARPGAEVTFTCVPPGDGERSALDRDGDAFPNGDEIAAGSDPASAASTPLRIPTATSSAPPTAIATATALSTATPTLSPTAASTVESTPTSAATAGPTATGATMRAQAWLPVGYRD